MPRAGVSPLTGDRTSLRGELNTPAHDMSRPTQWCMVDGLSKTGGIGRANITHGAALMSAKKNSYFGISLRKSRGSRSFDRKWIADLEPPLLFTPMTVLH